MDQGLNPYDFSIDDGYKLMRYKAYKSRAEKRAMEKASRRNG
jgi:hypothetical protein